MTGVASGRLSEHASPKKGHRACVECRRKKTKCDRIQPVCGLCQRVGGDCTFPTRRKQMLPRKGSQGSQIPPNGYQQRLDRLMDLLENKFTEGDESLHSTLPRGNLINDSESEPHPNDLANAGRTGQTVPSTTSLTPNDNGQSMVFFTSPQTNPIAADEIQPISHVSSKFSLDIPQELADELIGLFFDKVQPWLPLLHRPRFEAHYMKRQSGTLSRLHGYSLDEALIFYGMFALSARFSDHSSISHLDPTKRGAALAVRAREICDKGRLDLEPSSLLYLQGCILLAFYMYASGPYPQGWILTGVCVRMAYELGIGTLDAEQNDQQLDVTQWSADEELRRVWWLIWELDTFGSTISKRPYSIDWRRMMVKLPVSDEAWFSNTIVESAVLRTKPSEAWKTLRDSENQDQRAWFLVANYIMARVNDAVHANGSIPEKERQELSRAVACFELALPKHVRLNRVTPNPTESSCCNFIVSVHLMLTTTRYSLLDHNHNGRSESCSPSSDGSLEDIKSPYQDHARIISRWPPDHIALCHPFIACILLPRSFGSSVTTWERNSDDGLLEDMATLVISRFAECWQIGHMIIQIMEILKRGAPLNDQERELAKRFALYFPSKGTKSTQSPTSDWVQQNNQSPVEIQVVPGQTGLIEERQMPANNTLDTNPPIMTFAMDPVQPSPLAPQGFSIWPDIGEFYYDQGTGLDFMAL